MAISTSSYFSNSIVGVPQVAGEGVDISVNSSTPKFAIGTKFERQDGAVFRYAYFGGAVATAGLLVAPTASEVNLTYAASSTAIAPSATYQMPDEPVGVYPGSLGSRYIAVAATGSANQYAGGYVAIADGTGKCQTYRIKGNTAYGTPTATTIRLNLYDQIRQALDVTSVCNIVGSRWNDLAVATSATAIDLAGVSVTTAGATTFGWVQTQGLIGILSDGQTTPVIGALAVASSSNGLVTAWQGTGSGGVLNAYAGQSPIVGYVYGPAAASKVVIVDVELE